MAETVEEIRECCGNDLGGGRVQTLLAEIERLDKWSTELVTANAGLGLQAVEALTRLADAEAVCDAAGRVIAGQRLWAYQHAKPCILCHQHKGHSPRCPMGPLIRTHDAYLAGKKETE